MKTKFLLPFLGLFLSGCETASKAISPVNETEEILQCTRADLTRGIQEKPNYRLVFMARTFTETIQVFVDPVSSKTVVYKLKHVRGMKCVAFQGTPNIMYTPYDQSTTEINRKLSGDLFDESE